MKPASGHPRSISDGSDGRSISKRLNVYAAYVLYGTVMQIRGNKMVLLDIYIVPDIEYGHPVKTFIPATFIPAISFTMSFFTV